ncbi:MAG TPA: CsbD family protein [Blastocatellia bacterium]|nr:CsbD family protein [Blastocatellia bacterium]
MWNKDEVEGKGKQIKGNIKDKAGEVIGNPDLEAEGEAEHAEGDVQQGFGKARRKVGEAIEDVGEAIGGNR